MKKLLFTILSLFVVSLAGASQASAATTCTPIYGGGQSCVTSQVSINKMVKNPQVESNFEENIGKDKAVSLGDEVDFQITVTNNGNTNLTNVTVSDTLPAFTRFNAGPGSVNGNVLTFNLGTLTPGQTSSPQVLSVKINQVPNQDACELNTARVTTNEGPSDQDNAQFCIKSQGVAVAVVPGVTVFPAPKVVTTPPTGPEALPLLALLPTGFLGNLLRKKSR